MFKYLEDSGDRIRVRPTAEAMKVAMAVAMGQDYIKFGIDPFEAYMLVDNVRQFATEQNKPELHALCERMLGILRVHVQAHMILEEADNRGR